MAEFVVPGFRRGVDTCRIARSDPDAAFDAAPNAAGVRLMFVDDGAFLEVIFPDLDQLPFDDVYTFDPACPRQEKNLPS